MFYAVDTFSQSRSTTGGSFTSAQYVTAEWMTVIQELKLIVM